MTKNIVVNNNLNTQYSSKLYSAFINLTAPKSVINIKPDSYKKSHLPVIATTLAGTLISMLVLKKYSNTQSLLKMRYEKLSDALLIGLGSVIGGMTGGLIFGDKKDSKSVIKESIFQYANIAIPVCLTTGAINLSNKLFNKNSKYSNIAKSIGALAGMAIGMVIASFASNKINNKIFNKEKCEKRNFSPKDFIAQADDIVLALIYCKFASLKNLKMDRFIPLLFAFCGIEAGSKHNSHSKPNSREAA